MLTARSYPSFLSDAQEFSRRWLFESALPLWWQTGADHSHGGFHEKISPAGQPAGQPERLRVQARQVYVYAQAGALGWPGPWQAAMRHGLSFMLRHYQRPDRLFRSTLDSADPRIDLYEQAFVLFALAHAWRAEGRPDDLLKTATGLMEQLQSSMSLGDGAYRPLLPDEGLIRANPLMHLLEAALAWIEAGAGEPFRTLATQLCQLALDRLITPETGALGEVFSPDWSPHGGPDQQVYEPGHQFEWAYLLLEAQRLLGFDAQVQAIRLYEFGNRSGMNVSGHVTIFSVDRQGNPTDSRARLWAQTERLRTSLYFAAHGIGNVPQAEAAAVGSFGLLQRYLDTPVPGLWFDWLLENQQFETAPSPASSFYHVMTGLSELLLSHRKDT